MRILHVIDSLDPAGGGPPRVAVQLAATMAQGGHAVRLLSRRLPGESGDAQTVAAGGGWAGLSAFASVPGLEQVERLSVDMPGGWRGFVAGRLREGLHRWVSESDVVHLHGVWDVLLLRVASACRELGVPYVVRPAGMLDPWSLGQRWLKKRLALLIGYRRMLDGAAFVHALNADERQFVERLGLHSPVEVIPNGTFVEWMDRPREKGRFRSQHAQLGDKPYVLFLSRLHYKKGLDYLAEAFRLLASRHPDVMLVVAGPEEGAGEAFAARVAELGLSDRVLMPGPLYGEAKLDALVDATCFCLPSRQEGFSVAIIEALAMGTPVVISEPCHFPEVATAGAGAVVPLQAEQIAGALEEMLKDAGLRARCAAAGVKLIREHYTWPRIAERCVEAYQAHGAGGGSDAGGRGRGADASGREVVRMPTAG